MFECLVLLQPDFVVENGLRIGQKKSENLSTFGLIGFG